MEEGGSSRGIAVEVVQEADAVQSNMGEDPWLNDLILDKIFKYCTPGALSACRLVCKKWYSESLRVWGSSRPVKIMCQRKPDEQGEDGRKLEDEKGRGGVYYMSDFVRDFHTSSSSSPEEINGMARHKSFHLEFKLENGSEEVVDPLLLNDFWNRNGNWITRLKLSYSGPLDASWFKAILWCDYTPQLQELDIDIIVLSDGRMYDDADLRQSVGLLEQAKEAKRMDFLKSLKLGSAYDTYFLVDWKVYLGSCPNLENLDISENSDLETTLEMLTAIRDLRAEDKTRLSCLKSLSLSEIGNCNGRFASTVTRLLKESQLDLESLLVRYHPDVTRNEIQEMTTMFSNTLKKLGFSQCVALEASPFLGVPMAHLVSLVVEGKAFGNLSFLRELPLLQSLKLMLDPVRKGMIYSGSVNPPRRNSIISATNEEDMRGVALSSLASFYCDFVGDFEPEDLSRLHGWMPKLVRLELQLNSETFPTVCKLWPVLRHVSIFGGRIGDRGLVGLDTTMTNDQNQIRFNKPNITNLQDLRSFVVRPAYGRRRVEEGDLQLSCHSVKHGLSKLRRLEEVTISKTAVPENHAEEIEECMRMELPFAEIKVADDERFWL